MTDTIILIEYERGKSEWRPGTVETLSHIVGNFDCIAGLRELEAGATAPADNGAGGGLFNYPSFDAARTALALRQTRRELQQVKAQKLQAVKVLVGVDECCGECQDASESESQNRKGANDD